MWTGDGRNTGWHRPGLWLQRMGSPAQAPSGLGHSPLALSPAYWRPWASPCPLFHHPLSCRGLTIGLFLGSRPEILACPRGRHLLTSSSWERLVWPGPPRAPYSHPIPSQPSVGSRCGKDIGSCLLSPSFPKSSGVVVRADKMRLGLSRAFLAQPFHPQSLSIPLQPGV